MVIRRSTLFAVDRAIKAAVVPRRTHCASENRFGGCEWIEHEQYSRNHCADMVYLLVQALRFSRRSRTFCVSPSVDRLRFSRFADFSVRRAQDSDGLSFRGQYANRYSSVSIAG
jgi:hypothetical protein